MSTTVEVSQGRQARGRSLIAWVLAIVVGVHIAGFFGTASSGLQENRVLSTRPGLPKSMSELQGLPEKWDAYLTDNFPLRTRVIEYLNYTRYLLGYSGPSKVVVGRDGWLFYDDGTHMAINAGESWLPPEGMSYWVQGLKQRVDYLQSKNIKFYVLPAPVQEDIYPEHRPSWMPDTRVPTEIDELEKRATAAGLDNIIDVRADLVAEKTKQKLYDAFDTHWTGLGAYLAYRDVLSRMHRDSPDLEPLPITAFKPSDNPPAFVPRGLSLMLGIDNFVPHDRVSFATYPLHDPAKTIFLSDRKDWTAPQILLTGAPGGRTLLLLRDSFGTELLPFLKPHFSKIVMAHVQDGFFRKDLIEEYKPDVVLLEVIETGFRFSMNILP
jgi:hypothetical protein